MLTTLAVLLIVNAAWNAIVWPQFYRRITRDDRAHDEYGKATKFLVVHTVIIGISLLLAVASLTVAIVALLNA